MRFISSIFRCTIKTGPVQIEDGLLKALGGRLLAEAEHPKAESALLRSIQSSQAFLELVTQAEQGKIKGPRPPQAQSPRSRTRREPQAMSAPHPPKQAPRPPQ